LLFITKGNCIAEEGGKILGEMFDNNRTLTALLLFNNHLSDAGTSHIIESLEFNRSLQVLDLSCKTNFDFFLLLCSHINIKLIELDMIQEMFWHH
jgi:hypothetical protein